MAQYHETLQNILRNGIVDDRYPLDHACVQLPNGWYGINETLSGFQKILDKYEYDEMLVPSLSTKAVFADVPVELKGNVEKEAGTITHLGENAVEDNQVLIMSARPDLVIPQIDKLNARSYRDLPCRRIQRYFRYVNSKAPFEVSLITDTELPALDAVGIFAIQEEYDAEIKVLKEDLNKFITENLKLSTFITIQQYAIIFNTILPNGQVFEVARINTFAQKLSESIKFQVLERNNKPACPFILSVHISCHAFIASVAVHSTEEKIVLPKAVLRAYGTSYNKIVPTNISEDLQAHIDKSHLEFTPERWAKQVQQSSVFAITAENNGVYTVHTESGDSQVNAGQLESFINNLLAKRETSLSELEKAKFAEQIKTAIQWIPKAESAGKSVFGADPENPELVAVGTPFIPL